MSFTSWLLTNYPNLAMDLATFAQLLRTRGLLAALRAAIRRHPWLTLLFSNAATAAVIGHFLLRKQGGLKKFLLALLFSSLKAMPGAQGLIDAQTDKVAKDVRKKLVDDTVGDEKRYTALPARGLAEGEVLDILERYTGKDQAHWRPGKVSGGIYHGGDDLTRLIARAYEMFCLANPLHPDVFPMVRKMEAEVVAMTLRLFNGDDKACGTMTSGGTESILMAMKAYRDHAEATKGITEPEIVVPNTAHAAFDKAAFYFKMRIIRTPVDPVTFKADVDAMRAAIGPNTVALVASAPQFPQGVFDDVGAIAALGVERDIPVHVDCCLGSYLVPYLDRAGFPIPPFDFRLPGVTSISADTHKFGYTPKGSSTIMYRHAHHRDAQFFCVTDWPGGVYASPSMAGSRPGALIAGTWAAIMRMGDDGYLDACKKIMRAATHIRERLARLPEIKQLGAPEASVVCFTSADKAISIYHICDELSARGWNLNILQFPACVHLCVTYANHTNAEEFADDVEAAIAAARSGDSSKYKDGAAAIYGLAETVPDRSIIGTIAKKYIEAMYIA
uniref:sphinganine-1-phosphate aldolase n=1 Tax=Bicosoecida sp. CB-2014 TaxID=1486930 RepID=A0A7S1C432_9STRA|mmetsp:Transcript_11400/g.39782  ORF Transcript_11400/g.39782 Transcript_11400/m.39782 type:complete len:559 (+) Transcript_11400:67-1743(+)